jgi:2-polyprenyl-3-methyl-5-hydroxy-6-metoxy-1,4-benzoquinol methylase
MSIDKMRPKDIYEEILLIREKSGTQFYLENKDKFEHINCPACGKKENQTTFFKFGFEHKRCSSCNTLYVSPRPTQEMLFDYYNRFDAPKAWTRILTTTNNDRKYLQHLPRVKRLQHVIEQTQNERKKFVDLGAGNGNFAKAVLESSFFEEVIASDISTNCINSCKKQGLSTFCGSIDDFENESIDCLTFNDLIEHVFDPKEFLTSCFSKLKKEGVLMLSTPNGEGFDFKILKKETENIVPPEHIQFFNPESIKILLETCGFKVLDVTTPGILDVQIIKNQRDKKMLDLKTNNEFIEFLYSLDDEDIQNNFQEFLQKSNLSSHMLIFAKKEL